jgi:hypothetical protein
VVQAIELWAASAVPVDAAGEPLLKIGPITVDWRSVAIPVSWHAGVGGGSQRIVLNSFCERLPADTGA